MFRIHLDFQRSLSKSVLQFSSEMQKIWQSYCRRPEKSATGMKINKKNLYYLPVFRVFKKENFKDFLRLHTALKIWHNSVATSVK
jgi:hypothetical protein